MESQNYRDRDDNRRRYRDRDRRELSPDESEVLVRRRSCYSPPHQDDEPPYRQRNQGFARLRGGGIERRSRHYNNRNSPPPYNRRDSYPYRKYGRDRDRDYYRNSRYDRRDRDEERGSNHHERETSTQHTPQEQEQQAQHSTYQQINHNNQLDAPFQTQHEQNQSMYQNNQEPSQLHRDTSTKEPEPDEDVLKTLIDEIKAQGVIDKFRRNYLENCEDRHDFASLKNRVEKTVKSYIGTLTWNPELNRNKGREIVKRRVLESSYFSKELEFMLDKCCEEAEKYFMPTVEDAVYKFLGVEKPLPKSEESQVGNDAPSIKEEEEDAESEKSEPVPSPMDIDTDEDEENSESEEEIKVDDSGESDEEDEDDEEERIILPPPPSIPAIGDFSFNFFPSLIPPAQLGSIPSLIPPMHHHFIPNYPPPPLRRRSRSRPPLPPDEEKQQIGLENIDTSPPPLPPGEEIQSVPEIPPPPPASSEDDSPPPPPPGEEELPPLPLPPSPQTEADSGSSFQSLDDIPLPPSPQPVNLESNPPISDVKDESKIADVENSTTSAQNKSPVEVLIITKIEEEFEIKTSEIQFSHDVSPIESDEDEMLVDSPTPPPIPPSHQVEELSPDPLVIDDSPQPPSPIDDNNIENIDNNPCAAEAPIKIDNTQLQVSVSRIKADREVESVKINTTKQKKLVADNSDVEEGEIEDEEIESSDEESTTTTTTFSEKVVVQKLERNNEDVQQKFSPVEKLEIEKTPSVGELKREETRDLEPSCPISDNGSIELETVSMVLQEITKESEEAETEPPPPGEEPQTVLSKELFLENCDVELNLKFMMPPPSPVTLELQETTKPVEAETKPPQQLEAMPIKEINMEIVNVEQNQEVVSFPPAIVLKDTSVSAEVDALAQPPPGEVKSETIQIKNPVLVENRPVELNLKVIMPPPPPPLLSEFDDVDIEEDEDLESPAFEKFEETSPPRIDKSDIDVNLAEILPIIQANASTKDSTRKSSSSSSYRSHKHKKRSHSSSDRKRHTSSTSSSSKHKSSKSSEDIDKKSKSSDDKDRSSKSSGDKEAKIAKTKSEIDRDRSSKSSVEVDKDKKSKSSSGDKDKKSRRRSSTSSSSSSHRRHSSSHKSSSSTSRPKKITDEEISEIVRYLEKIPSMIPKMEYYSKYTDPLLMDEDVSLDEL